MKFTELELEGVFLIEMVPIEDERGFFARTFCRSEWMKRGLNPCVEQSSISYNKKRGTLRGMHYQEAPYGETKIVQCIKGAIYDVILDLRPESKSYQKWVSVILSPLQMLYIPEGIAHGFQTLEDETEVFYQISAPFMKDYSKGVRFNDPVFKIEWPLTVSVISKKDEEHPLVL